VKNIKVVDSECCGKSDKIKALIEQVARDKNVPVHLQSVSNLADIVGLGVMSTPALIIDGTLVHQGGIPSRDMVEQWLV
jgi:hypothetical protein